MKIRSLVALLLAFFAFFQLVACSSTVPRSEENSVEEQNEDPYLTHLRDSVAAIETANFMYPSQDELLSYDVYDTMVVVTGLSNAKKNEEVTYYSQKKFDLVIPAYYDGVPVRGIDERAFDNTFHINWQIEKLTLPDTLWFIGKSAFREQELCRLETIPDSIIEIRDGAFYNCALSNILALPDSIFAIGESAFAETGITYVSIGKNITSIPEGAFSNCPLYSIEIPAQVTEIGAYAFSWNNNLTYVTLYNPNITINSTAFWCCPEEMYFNGYPGSTAAYYASDKGYTFGIIVDDEQIYGYE